MKKELLMASALVGTMGVASVAEAVTATFSGNHRVGVEFDSATGGTDTNAVIEQSSFSVSLSEVTDANLYKRAKSFYENCHRVDQSNGKTS